RSLFSWSNKMIALSKVFLVVVITILGIYLVVTVFRTNWEVQLASLALAYTLNILSMGVSSTAIYLVALLLPTTFIIIISVFLILLGGLDNKILWQASNFVFSMLWARGILAQITYANIVDLPFSRNLRKDFMTFRAIME